MENAFSFNCLQIRYSLILKLSFRLQSKAGIIVISAYSESQNIVLSGCDFLEYAQV
jgi:hypothetical protein